LKLGYLEPLGGASGNMLLGAALHAGWPAEQLQRFLGELQLRGWHMHVQPALKRQLACLHLDFEIAAEPGHRHLGDIVRLIRDSSLAGEVQEPSIRVFERLAAAEAAVHGTTIEDVHFHEVGACDAILDIVGFCSWLHDAEIEQLYCAPLPFGHGVIRCAHGVFPNPGPATVELLRGIPQRGVDLDKEMVTPTAAALLSTLAKFEPPPVCTFEAVGYGAGTMDFPFPNVVRLQVGRSRTAARGRGSHDTAEELTPVPHDHHHGHEHGHEHG
jgi:pyridinium-3,5-bisthiocarboxylic acid mononucleotide nickel chelatase